MTMRDLGLTVMRGVTGGLMAGHGAQKLFGAFEGPGLLTEHGATPVPYGDGLADRLTAAAPQGIDAFIDCFGPDYVQLAVDLGIAPRRIETIAAFQKAQELGAKSEGSVSASTTKVLTEIADLAASGAIEIPIAATYPLDRVADAFAQLERQQTHGKIVLIP